MFYKFALLWGEAQLCLPYVCLYKKIADSYPKVTYSYPRVHKSPHKFMLTSYMKYFAKFLALLLHNTSFLQFYFIFNNS